jgi:hypothetical protein
MKPNPKAIKILKSKMTLKERKELISNISKRTNGNLSDDEIDSCFKNIDFLINGFDAWQDTPEGHDYWSEISKRLFGYYEIKLFIND